MKNKCQICGGKLKREAKKYCSYKCNAIAQTKHGMHKTRQWFIWTHFRQRCINPKDAAYKHYGGRGITFNKKWSEFNGFWNDMKDGYADNLTLERIDVNGNYTKSNCKWIPQSMQTRNMRKNIVVKIGNKNNFLFNLAEKYKIPYGTLYSRIFIYGVSPEEAVKHKSLQHGHIKAKDFINNTKNK